MGYRSRPLLSSDYIGFVPDHFGFGSENFGSDRITKSILSDITFIDLKKVSILSIIVIDHNGINGIQHPDGILNSHQMLIG